MVPHGGEGRRGPGGQWVVMEGVQEHLVHCQCFIFPFTRLCQHQRPQHAGEAGQRDGHHRAGHRDHPLRDGRGGLQRWEVCPVPPAAVLQVGRVWLAERGQRAGMQAGLAQGLHLPAAFQTNGAAAACSGLALPRLDLAQSFAAVSLALAFPMPFLSPAQQLDLQIVLLQDFAGRAHKQDSDILPPDPVFTLSISGGGVSF